MKFSRLLVINRALFLAVALLSIPSAAAIAQDPGKEDLDNATEAKLNASNPRDLTTVINHLQSALDKGLNEDDEQFAEQLLAGTLLERAEMLSRLIFDKSPPDPQWARIRRVALADIERAFTFQDELVQGNFLRGKLLALPGGDRDAAMDAFTKVIDAPEDKAKAQTRAEALIHRANLKTDDEEKLADYDRAVKLVPKNLEVLRSRAMFHLRNQRVEQALADFDRAIELDPKDAANYEAKGLALLVQQKLDEALQLFEKATELSPDTVSPLQNQARVLGGLRRYDDAIAVLTKALEIDPKAINILMFRAQVHIQKDDEEQALVDIDRVLEIQPELPRALQAKAELLARNERADEAAEIIEGILARGPESAELLTQLAVFRLIAEQYGAAIDVFGKVLDKDEKNVAALRGRSDALLSIGEHAQAIEDYERALKLAPEDDTILNNLAWVLATSPKDDLRNAERSLELAKKACEVTEYKEAHILSTLAAAYAEGGDFEKAREWSEKAVDLGKKEAEDEKEPGHAAEQLTQLQNELESYRQEQPWRELQQKDKEAQAKKDTSDDLDAPPASTSDF